MKFAVVTLFPDQVRGVVEYGVVGRAAGRGILSLRCENPRDYATDAHRTVDDRPYGGGPGMVMKYEPLAASIDAVRADMPSTSPVVYLSPQGRVF
ncbi:MAG: tRNA (guanosine(37)-N1)-methyltransferase TrmD, partial [Pseudomonadota bacterium]